MVPGLVDVGVHPGDGNVHLALTEHGIVFRSTDEGVSWARAGRVGQAPGHVIPDPAKAATWFATGRQLLRSSDDGNFWDVYLEFEDDPRIPTNYRALLWFSPAASSGAASAWRTTTILIESSHEAVVSKARAFEDFQLQSLLRSVLPDPE